MTTSRYCTVWVRENGEPDCGTTVRVTLTEVAALLSDRCHVAVHDVVVISGLPLLNVHS